MRDSKRIQRISLKLMEYWYKVPDWRFGQLIENFKTYIGCKDIFYIEDDEFERLLDKFFEEMLEGDK